MTEKLIGLLDCNNFFVSCERLFRPDLEGKPVVVLSSNDGCVVARSQEVKDIGVLMGVPYFQIKDIVKDKEITTFSSNFTLYRDISRRIFSIMRNLLDEVEEYSIDEAFFTIDTDHLHIIETLRKKIKNDIGIPVSIGVSNTKTLAKYANKLAKKTNGTHVLFIDDWKNVTHTVPISEIWGVGKSLELSFKNQGITTVKDFLSADPSRIRSLFGIAGLRLHSELNGVFANYHKINKDSSQSITSSRSFKESTQKLLVLEDAVAYHVRQATSSLRKKHLKTKVLRVYIRPSRHGDFAWYGGSCEVVLDTPSNDTMVLLKLANQLLRKLFEPNVPYKKAGICLSGLMDENVTQFSLLEPEERIETNQNSLISTIDYINKKNDKELILIGSRLLGHSWEARLNIKSPAYTTKWSELSCVKA